MWLAQMAQTAMYLRIAGGYLGLPLREVARCPIMYTLFTDNELPGSALQLKAFLMIFNRDGLARATEGRRPTAEGRPWTAETSRTAGNAPRPTER